MAICGTLPEMTDRDLVIELATMTLMIEGRVDGGLLLLPGRVLHVPPQLAGLGMVVSA